MLGGGAHAGRGRVSAVLIVCQRLTTRFVRTSRARRGAVARAGSVRSLVRVRHEVRECAFGRGAPGGQDAVGQLLARGELAGARGPVGGDDDQAVGVLGLVDADEAQVGEGAEADGLQALDDLVTAGGGGVAGPSRPGRGDPDQPAPLIGQGEKVRAVRWCLPE
jgi:hypothetical protein